MLVFKCTLKTCLTQNRFLIMSWCVSVLQMSDGWGRMLKWHSNGIKVQKMGFGSSDTLFLKTGRVALRRRYSKKNILESLSLNHCTRKLGVPITALDIRGAGLSS
jgi:hypothetical protein